MDSYISVRALAYRRDIIQRNDNFLPAIKQHYLINNELYKKQPLFFKTIFQESRFNIVLAMCCFIFGNQASSVSEIKTLCSRYKIASPNSVIAIIALLKTTQRIKVWRSELDRRKVLITPMPKGLEDLKTYMSSALIPAKLLFPLSDINLDILDDDNLRHAFFHRVAEYLFRGITFQNIFPEVGIFIDKDGGRMIMLHLYLQSVDIMTSHGAVIEHSANALAKMFFVSRIHVTRIIKSAEDCGYLKDRKNGLLDIYPSFIALVENYAGLYLAYATHYLNILPRD